MSGALRSITVEHCPVNGEDTFTHGDVVSGHVTVTLDKQCHIRQLFVKFKGKAEVQWSERRASYEAKVKYFSIKCFFIIPDENKQTCTQGAYFQTLLSDEYWRPYSSVVPAGCHLYPFTFQFPDQDLPASFKSPSHCAKIVYTLEARLSRPMRKDSKASSILTFVSKTVSLPPFYTLMKVDLQTPQHYYKEKTMTLFSSGTVAMDVHIDKMGYYQGEGIQVVASIQNNSSHCIKPKYCVYRKHSFYAQGKRIVHTKDLLKEVGDVIPPSAHQTVTRVITIPPDMDPSILNCTIIQAEYRLRVYLDVKLALDPKIKFDIVILPASGTPGVEQRPFISPASATPTGTPGVEQRPFISPASGTPTGTPGVERSPAISGFGGEALFRSPGQPAWSIVGSYGMHSSLSDF